jgi:hypothetical protein
MKQIVRCYNCDSEYTIEYEEGMLSDDAQYCIVCQEPVELELIEEE